MCLFVLSFKSFDWHVCCCFPRVGPQHTSKLLSSRVLLWHFGSVEHGNLSRIRRTRQLKRSIYPKNEVRLVFVLVPRRSWTSWTLTPSSCERWSPCTSTAWASRCSCPAPSTRSSGASKTRCSPRSTPWSPKWTNILGWCGRWALLHSPEYVFFVGMPQRYWS